MVTTALERIKIDKPTLEIPPVNLSLVVKKAAVFIACSISKNLVQPFQTIRAQML